MEMDQINEYQVFKDHSKAKYDPKSKQIIKVPQGYQRIKVHLVVVCKHDGYQKVRLAEVSNLTPEPIDSIYFGVV